MDSRLRGNDENEAGNDENEAGNDGNDGNEAGNDGNDGNEAGNDGNDGNEAGNDGNDGNEAGNDGNEAGNDGNEAGNDGNEAGNDGSQLVPTLERVLRHPPFEGVMSRLLKRFRQRIQIQAVQKLSGNFCQFIGFQDQGITGVECLPYVVIPDKFLKKEVGTNF